MTDAQISDVGVGLTALTVVIGIVTLILIIRQINIGDSQKDLADKQLVLAQQELDLVKQQGELMQRQETILSQKARLITYADIYRMDQMQSGMNGIRLAIYNYGNKTADNCTVALMIPPGAPYPIGTHYMSSPIVSYEDSIAGVKYSRYEFDVKRLFFPNHTVVLPELLAFSGANNVLDTQIRYQLVYADDSTPSHYSYFPLQIDRALAFKDEEKLASAE